MKLPLDDAPKYAVDTCALTTLRRSYPPDIFMPVWDFIGELADKHVICSVDEVLEELKVQDDEVLEWAKAHPDMFEPLDSEIQLQAKKILSTHTGLYDHKKRKSSADPFLIALTVLRKCALVTEENPSTDPQRPKIPNVCRDYQVECIRLLEMLRREGLRLHRG